MRARRELRALFHALRSSVEHRLGRGRPATSAFVGQARAVRRASFPLVADPEGLAATLDELGLRHRREGEALYIPPQTGVQSLLGARTSLYPDDAAYWLLPAAEERDAGRSAVLAGNVLHAHGLGPRIHDLLTLARGGASADVWVTEGVGEDMANDVTRGAMTARIADLIASGRLAASGEDWRSPSRFRSTRSDGAARCIGFPHLRVPDPDALIGEALGRDARSDLHFGLENVTRGQRYLYQSVPSVGASGRRDSARRWSMIAEMLETSGTRLEDRLVLDVGCNAGMMLAAALSEGAAWGLGWDRPVVARRAREILLALGCTRFDLFGGELGAGYALRADVPDRLVPRLSGSVVLYLAIRHHIGWVNALGAFPWRTLVYEGGETETAATLPATVAPLRRLCEFEIAEIREFRDSETGSRPLAVLVRSDGGPRA